jgi:hypothetical protein
MRTFNRNGVQIEQCESCRGIFLDYGELEAVSRLESQWSQPAPPYPGAVPPAPAWGSPHPHGYHHKHKYKSFGKMFFSS